MEYIYHYDSPLGGITLASDGEKLNGLWFDGQKYFGKTLGREYEERELPIFEETAAWLSLYFAGRKPGSIPSLSMRATPFQRNVWEIMLSIPYGWTMTYREIAEKVAKRRGLAHMSAQAVGGAVAHNAISIIIPCHRVVGTGGSLTGYAGGLERKVKLLALEGVEVEEFFVPRRGTAL